MTIQRQAKLHLNGSAFQVLKRTSMYRHFTPIWPKSIEQNRHVYEG